MTKADIVKQLRLEDKGEVDYALPQYWLDHVVNTFGFDYGKVRSSFVMFYPSYPCDGIARIYPLNSDAAAMLWTIDHNS